MKRFFMFAALATFVLAIPFTFMYWAPPQQSPGASGTYMTADGNLEATIGKGKAKGKLKRKVKRKVKRKAKRKTKRKVK